MTARLLLLCCIGAMFAVSCDDRADGLKGFNDPPSIVLQAQRGGAETDLLIDSVKLSNPAFSYMPFIIRVEDLNKNIKHVLMDMVAGSGYLQYREDSTRDTVRIIDDKGIYRFVPEHTGNMIIRFVVTDYFGEADSAELRLYVFNNLPPVAALAVTYLGAADQYEYLFDASGSFDNDRSFGGVVSKYVFTVNNVRIAETVTPAIPYIFPGPGSYTCKVQVTDSDGAVSKEVTQQIQVP